MLFSEDRKVDIIRRLKFIYFLIGHIDLVDVCIWEDFKNWYVEIGW